MASPDAEVTVEVEYHCPNCEMDFVVYNNGDTRNTHCCWCNTHVVQTGQVRRIEGDEVVTYKDGVEVEREPKRR